MSEDIAVDELEAIYAELGAVTDEDKAELLALVQDLPEKWIPNPGPQTDAYYSKADCLLFGGEPGGGKSQLILGLAFNEHRQSMIFRREYSDLEGLIEDALKIHGSREGFNGSPPPRLRINERQLIRFRAAQRVGDERQYMGQGRDLLGIDEATHFAETQIRFLMGWVRSDVPGQRTRTVLATNPPLTAEGLWVIKMFAPWLDARYPNPAEPGELRWVLSDEEGKDEWRDGPEDGRIINGDWHKPQSRTYIPSSVEDNPFYMATGYKDTLNAMPEPYRSLLMGGFKTAFVDQDRQVIPTSWVVAAQERWKADGWKDYEMTCMALDPAGGGRDTMEIACRHRGWYAEMTSTQGDETADGSVTAAEVTRLRRGNCPVVIDAGGGYAGASIERFKDNGIPFHRFDGAKATAAKTKDGLGFANDRAKVWWKFREALDPDQEGGSIIALPDDPEMVADLTAPTFTISARGIQIESKDNIRKKIGRSPGKGDVVVMALEEGNKAIARNLNQSSSGHVKVVTKRSMRGTKRRR